MQSIQIRIKETASYGDIEGIYEPEISIQTDRDDEITIGAVNKDGNDDRSVYFTLDRVQSLVLADTLIRLFDGN